MDSFRLFDFQASTKQDWKNAVIKELKNDPYTSVEFEIDGLTFDPYYTLEETIDFRDTFPRHWDMMRAGEDFDLRNKSGNVHFATSVSQNMTAPNFIFSEIETDQLVRLLEGNTALYPILSPQSEAAAVKANALLKNHPLSDKFIWLQSYSPSGNIGLIETMLDLSENIIEAGPNWLNTMDRNKAGTNGLFINMKLSGNFIKDIVKARAYKSLWYNWLEQQGRPIKTPIFINVYWDYTGQFPDHIVDQSVNILIAANCQADRIKIKVPGLDKTEDRTIRHVFNVASIESHIDSINDAVSGSYFISYVSAMLAKSAWEAYCG